MYILFLKKSNFNLKLALIPFLFSRKWRKFITLDFKRKIMEIKVINKSIRINAPREIVWEVLVNDAYNENWFAEFAPGTTAKTDWEIGSKVIFADESNNGMIGKIIGNEPFEGLSIEHLGMLSDGKEDYESTMAKQMKGALEIYKLTVENSIVKLEIAADMGADYYFQMAESWEKALHKIKHLAESLS